MPEHLLNIKIVQPGRSTGLYRPVDYDTLQLEKVVHPNDELPFDVAALPTSLTPFGDPITVLVLSSISHPANTQIEARLLGAIQRDGFPYLLAVPTGDERMEALRLDTLPPALQEEVLNALQSVHPGEWRWLSVAEVEPQLHEAAVRYRQAKENGRPADAAPAWKPQRFKRLSPSFDEAERYTAAEYTFFELPFHFQEYVSEHLAPDERVLYAAPRPAMTSYKKRSWLERERLQAGVLILTTQRLIHLHEIRPLDNTNIRYGYHATVGALERFAGATLQTVSKESLILRTEWRAREGTATIEWESPSYTRSALEELLSFLQAFRVEDPAACILRRSSLPPAPQPLPPLRDSAANETKSLLALNEQFSAALAAILAPGEEARAWALIPDWFAANNTAQALVVTERRLFILPTLSQEIPLNQITTLEYQSSVLESFLSIQYYRQGTLRRSVISFPFPVESAFHDCFESARRCLAVTPLC